MHEWSTLMRIMCIEKWACMRMRWCKCLITLLDVWGCLGVVSHKLLCSAFLSDTLFHLKKDMTWHFNPLSKTSTCIENHSVHLIPFRFQLLIYIFSKKELDLIPCCLIRVYMIQPLMRLLLWLWACLLITETYLSHGKNSVYPLIHREHATWWVDVSVHYINNRGGEKKGVHAWDKP